MPNGKDIEFGKDVCRDLNEACSREWLEANGLGGFASSTIPCINTRKYHSILTAAVKPPVDRKLLVNQVEETLVDGSGSHPFSSHQYSNWGPHATDAVVTNPEGYKHLSNFALDPWPVWTYELGRSKVQKSLFMVYGKNTTVLAYRLLDSADASVRLSVRPLLSGRDFYFLHRQNEQLNPEPRVSPDQVSFTPYSGLPAIYIRHNGSYEESFYWYRNFFYAKELEMGHDATEDCWSPGELVFKLSKGETAFLIFSTEPQAPPPLGTLEKDERTRRSALNHLDGKEASGPARILLQSADKMIVRRGKEFKSIIAGYPWFADWGRDTFISIFGLCFSSGRKEDARSILDLYSRFVNHGMIPNFFPESSESPGYNTVDASLWFILAAYRYWEKTQDTAFVRETLWPKCMEIIRSYQFGTRYHIKMDEDSLISAGTNELQLTWMDAMFRGRAVTPRAGKPVEIQALWFNALNAMSAMGASFGEDSESNEFRVLARRCQASFDQAFWFEEGGYLYDVVTDDAKDASIRPNQIFALSLPFSMISKERAASVLKVVQTHLLTPYGLRSLAPSHPAYQGTYAGTLERRDKAYHQGTVWSWLMGPYITAYLKTHNYSENAKRKARTWVEPLVEHLYEAGLGSVSEIFDGDEPHAPRGCFAQAWSAGELLRILSSEIEFKS